jgi:hypothetical protein
VELIQEIIKNLELQLINVDIDLRHLERNKLSANEETLIKIQEAVNSSTNLKQVLKDRLNIAKDMLDE